MKLRRINIFLMKAQFKYSKMIKIAIFSFATFFVGAGIFFTPKFPTTDNNAATVALNPEGTAAEQARTLLRKVNLTGKCSSELATLDPAFATRVGQVCQISRDQIRAYLGQAHINEWEVGGNLDLPVSSLVDSKGNVQFAKYFVIHDTSFPRYSGSFPTNIDDESWEWNRLSKWMGNVTHIFVNRLGDSKTTTPFNEGMTATKTERYVLGDASSKGLYLHVELIQPRKALKGYGRNNDVDSPKPGFTPAQYKRLALLYTVASVRKGEWMIPGFHAAVDQNIKYCHDDPQGFELNEFFNALNELWTAVETPANQNPNKVGSGGQ
jgi:hypothetical protein